jgi:hypothetical protein
MLLTDAEREFLAAFIFEATTEPFKGAATADLRRREIYYDDLGHLMAAYYRENPLDQQGFGGNRNSSPPPCPWPDRASALRRDEEAASELKISAAQTIAS